MKKFFTKSNVTFTIFAIVAVAVTCIIILSRQNNLIEIVVFPNDGPEVGAMQSYDNGGNNIYRRYLTPEEFSKLDTSKYRIKRVPIESMDDALKLRQAFIDNNALLMDPDEMLGRALDTWPAKNSIAKN